MRRTAVAGLVVVALGLLLVGCSGPGTASTSPTPRTTPSFDPFTVPPLPARPTEPLRITKETTKPGTVLKFGQQALVPGRVYDPVADGYTQGVLGIVVHRFQKAPGSSIKGNFSDDSRDVLKSATAYYAKYVVTNESGDNMTPAADADLVRRRR